MYKRIGDMVETLKYIPRELVTNEKCLEAVKRNGKEIQYVPKELYTVELCEEAVRSNKWKLDRNRQADYETVEEILVDVVKNNRAAFSTLNREVLTEAICMEVVRHEGILLKDVPEKKRTRRVVDVALANTEFYPILKYIPADLMDRKIAERIQSMYENEEAYIRIGDGFVISKEAANVHYVLHPSGYVQEMYPFQVYLLLKRNGLSHSVFDVQAEEDERIKLKTLK